MHWVSENRSEQVAGKPLPTGNGSVEHAPAKAQTARRIATIRMRLPYLAIVALHSHDGGRDTQGCAEATPSSIAGGLAPTSA